MRISILGVGSIGGLLLGSLGTTNHELVAVSRGLTAKRISLEGLALYKHNGVIEVLAPDRFQVVDTDIPVSYNEFEKCDLVIICGKSGDTEELARIADQILKNEGIAITIQNGLGNVEILSGVLGSDRVVGGSTTHGAWRDEDGGVHWAGNGDITIGSVKKRDPRGIEIEIIETFNSAGLNSHWTEDLQSSLWSKAMINVAINPVCAISGIRNGVLEKEPMLLSLSFAAAHEVARVAQARGIDIPVIDIEEHVLEVIKSTSDNRCSMLQDLMAGRPTEIDQLCGTVGELAEIHGIAVPVNTTLHALVRAIEMSNV